MYGFVDAPTWMLDSRAVKYASILCRPEDATEATHVTFTE
jgi:hypothetical protein